MSAPRDYAELFQKYYGYVVALVHKMGIDEANSEDVACEILARFYERDFLNKYNPDLVFVHDGHAHNARFKSFLSKFVITYLRGHRDKQRRLKIRELLVFDTPVNGPAGSPAGPAGTTSWGELHGGDEPSAEDVVAEQDAVTDLLRTLREHVARVPRRSKFDTCDLVALLDEVIRQIYEYGEWDLKELRQIFGVSSAGMHSWMWWLRENLAEALDRPLPPKRSHRAAR